MKKIIYTFNEHFNIPNKGSEHLDILMNSDIEAFIDPNHIKSYIQNPIARAIDSRSNSFLEDLNANYIVTKDKTNGVKFLSRLKEANEYHLGYSDENVGKGVGSTKADVIYESLINNKFAKSGITITNQAQNVLLLVKGIGQDNMSDILANVCRDIFADFTFKQCLKYSIPVMDTRIEYYDSDTKKWKTMSVKLPYYNNKPIILVPQFLVSGTRIYPSHFNWYISSNYISKDILCGKIKMEKEELFICKLKKGGMKPIVKNINTHFRKPKEKLIDYVEQYSDSLINFQDHVKENYFPIDYDQLSALYKKAS